MNSYDLITAGDWFSPRGIMGKLGTSPPHHLRIEIFSQHLINKIKTHISSTLISDQMIISKGKIEMAKRQICWGGKRWGAKDDISLYFYEQDFFVCFRDFAAFVCLRFPHFTPYNCFRNKKPIAVSDEDLLQRNK